MGFFTAPPPPQNPPAVIRASPDKALHHGLHAGNKMTLPPHIARAHREHKHGGYAALKNHNIVPLYSREEIHDVLHFAADAAKVPLPVIGAICYLESEGCHPNAKTGIAEGLFQIQYKTGQMIIAKYGYDIAKDLQGLDEKNNSTKYAGLIDHLQQSKSNFGSYYKGMIKDPYVNALLGAYLTRLNAEEGNIPLNVAHLNSLYQVHLLGQQLGQRPGLLKDIVPANYINANKWVLGYPTAATTIAEADRAVGRNIHHFTVVFEQSEGRLQAEKAQRVAHENAPSIAQPENIKSAVNRSPPAMNAPPATEAPNPPAASFNERFVPIESYRLSPL